MAMVRGMTLAAGLVLAAASQAGTLPRAVAERARAAAIPEDAIAAVVRRAGGGDAWSFRGAEAMPPASTIKVLTSIVALETLGPQWRGTSELLVRGPVRQGVLRGDVVLRGRADVDLDDAALRRMLQRLRLKGVREIRGDLVLDRTYFAPPRTDVGMAPFDETPEFRYNVVPDALMLNANLVGLEIVADARRVRVASYPPIDGVSFASRMGLVDADCAKWEDTWRLPAVVPGRGDSLTVWLEGAFPRDCAASTDISMIDRTRYAEGLVRALWRELGGRWRGHAREAAEPAEGEVVATHRSRDLAEIVRDIDKRSDNPNARAVFLVLGAESPQGAGEPTALRAERVVREWLRRHGLDDASLVLENGSGLSRRERVSPALLASVLEAARASRWAPELESSLPIVGIDGAMRSRLPDRPEAGASRIKTGTLRDVSAVAGYVQADDGERYVVAAMIHHDNAVSAAARPVLDALLDWVRRGMPPE